MAFDLATGLVTSKLSGVVGDVEKGLGLDEDSRDAASEKALMETETQRKKEERARHKEYIHESREAQRKHMQSKYTLDFQQKGSKSSSSKKTSAPSAPPPSSQPTSGRQGGQDGDKKCIVS